MLAPFSVSLASSMRLLICMGDCFTKNPLLRGVRKYIGGVVHLLCHVEGVVDDRGQGAGYTPR